MRIQPVPVERQGSPLGFLADLVLLAGISWFFNVCQPEIVGALRPRTGLMAALALHLLAMVAMVWLGLRLTFQLWRHPARRRGRGGAGLLFVLAACLLVYQAANAGAYLLASRDLYALTLATDDSPDARMRPLPSGSLMIEGPLGPNLMRDFRVADAAFGPFTTIEISSPGGFVGRALEFAEYVERRGLTVVVRGECLSACVPIAVASRESYADEDAVFGFHRVSTPVELTSEMAGYSLELLKHDMLDFLRRHRVPESVLEEAARHGADSMHFVSARDMVAMGIISGVLADRPGSCNAPWAVAPGRTAC